MLLKGNSSKISAKGVNKWFRLSHLGKEKSFLMYTQYGTLTWFWLMNNEKWYQYQTESILFDSLIQHDNTK